MADFSFPELNSDQGTQTADYLRNVANAAANTVCGIYQNYPSGIIPDLGDPTGIGEFTDGLLNRLCAPRGQVPPPPTAPFSGGQCVCTQYRVQGTYNGFGIGSGNFDLFAQGPIGEIVNNKAGGTDNRYGFFSGAPACGGRVFNGVIQSELDGTVSITSVTVFPSAPDTCGDPPKKYPKVTVPPSVYSPTININKPGGSVNVPVTVIPTLIKPTLTLRPEFNVKVGPINVNFNLGGVDFSIDTSGGTSITLPSGDSRPTLPPSTSPKSPTGQPCNLDEVNRKLDELKVCACAKKKVLKSVSYPAAKGRQVVLPSETVFVVLDSTPTAGIKYQASEGNAPDVHFLGWASFGISRQGGERIPLNFSSFGIEAPPRATSFAYSLSYNSLATLTIHYLEDE